jgi:single-strand DNA-binding protein
VAESESYKDKSGEKQEKTCWWNCDIWGRSGETVAQYFSKGDGIIIEGSVRQDVRENEEGKRTFYSVRVNRWEFPMSRNGGETAAPKPRASARPDATDDDEIPF